MLLLVMVLAQTSALDFSQCDRLCMEEYNPRIGEKFRVFFPSNQIELTNNKYTLSVYAGDLASRQFTDPCDNTGILYSMDVHPKKWDDRMVYVDYWFTKDLHHAKYYLQLRMDRTCMLGPWTIGNEFTSFSISPAAQIVSAPEGNDGENGSRAGSPPSGPTASSDNTGKGRISAVAIIAVASAGFLISSILAVLYWRHTKTKPELKDRDENIIVVVGNDETRNESTAFEDPASTISKAYREALANPRWSLSLDSTHEKIMHS